MSAIKRINKQIQHIQSNPSQKFTFKTSQDKYRWEVLIKGPVFESSPYQGCMLRLQVDIPLGYPFESPKIKFLNKVYHPNVSPNTGEICLATIQDKWSPALTIKAAILEIIQLLRELPTTTSQYLNGEAFDKLRLDKKRYLETAKQWADKYSCAAPPF